MRGLICIVLTVTGSLAFAQESDQIVLPRQMGAINDYAAVLGSARHQLEASLLAIKQEFDVQLVILATIFDPFDNAQLYAQRIWESWKLGKRTALLVFVKEQVKNQWAFELRASDDLAGVLRIEHRERLRQGLAHHLERKRIKTAMEEAVAAVRAMLDGSYGQPPPTGTNGRSPLWVVLLLGGLVGLGGVALGLRAFFRNRCPRCGARLRRYRSAGRAGAQYRSCPYCGYARIR